MSPEVLTASWSTAISHAVTAVGISRGIPRKSAGFRRLRALEPGKWFRSVTPDRYLELYTDILDRLDPTAIHDQLAALGSRVALVCWESAADCHAGSVYCHRHLAAKWLEDRLGIEVPEFGHPNLDRFAYLRARGIAVPDYRVPRSITQQISIR